MELFVRVCHEGGAGRRIKNHRRILLSAVVLFSSLKCKTWPELRNTVQVKARGTNCFSVLVSIFKVYPLLCHLVSFSLSLALLPFLSQQKYFFVIAAYCLRAHWEKNPTFSDQVHAGE